MLIGPGPVDGGDDTEEDAHTAGCSHVTKRTGLRSSLEAKKVPIYSGGQVGKGLTGKTPLSLVLRRVCQVKSGCRGTGWRVMGVGSAGGRWCRGAGDTQGDRVVTSGALELDSVLRGAAENTSSQNMM